MRVRNVEPSDLERVLAVMTDWWGGRDVRSAVYRGLFVHFRSTSFVVEDDNGQLIAFLLGYLSQTFLDQAFINWIGVHPDHRNTGIARMLYERFYEVARENGRTLVKSDTGKVNQASLRWHTHMGFSVEEDGAFYTFSKRV